jgi:hypothetical protein
MSRSIINRSGGRSGGRSIINRSGGAISVICDLPLNLVNTNSMQNTINLGGLNSYGISGQVIKVNSNADGLEYADDNNTTYTGGSNISIDGNNAINLDATLTNLDTINTFKIGGNANSEITLLINNGNLFNADYLKINSTGKVIGQNIKDTRNNILGTDNTSGIIASTNMSKEVNTINGNITLTSTDTTYTVALPLTLSATNIIGLSGLTSYGNANQILKMNGTNTIVWSNETDTTYTVSTPLVLNNNVISLNGISGYGGGIGQSGKRQLIRTNANASALEYFDQPDFINSATLPLSISIDGVISLATTLTLDRLNMTSGNAIYFKGSSDVNHYAKYVNDGVEIGGYGNNNAPCFQVVNTYPLQPAPQEPTGPPIPVFQVYRDKIITNQKLYMTSQPLYFRDDASHSIKYQSDGDCMEFGSYSNINDADPVFKFVNTFNSELLLSINKGNNTFEKTTNFNNDIQMVREKYLYFDVGLLSNNNWIKATDEDGQDGLKIQGSADVLITTETYSGKIFLNGNTLAISATLTTFDNDITIEGDFVGTDCDLTIDGVMRIGQGLNMRDNVTLGEINMADGRIYWRNGYKNGENTFVTDLNHFSVYSGGPVDGIRHQGWNGVALGYTNGGPGTALYTNAGGVFLGNGSPVTSDDRIKFNETKITYNALETINKLVVVEYDKKYNRDLPETQYGEEMENHLLNDTPQKEYGYIAQDTWNNIPELRFTIKGVDETIPENFDEEGLLIEDCKVRNSNSQGEEFIDRKYLSIDYNNINVLNVRAVQELYEIVKQQQEQINKLLLLSNTHNT